MTHRYERHPSSGLCLAMFLALGLACDRHATLKLGDVQEQRVSADVNGDGTADVVVLRKVVMDIIGVQEQYPSYKVTIEIRDGQSGKTLFQSPEYEESTIGIFVTEGDLRIHPKDDGPAVVEYVQTTTYTEDEDSEPTRVHHVFEWNGSQIQTSTRSAT